MKSRINDHILSLISCATEVEMSEQRATQLAEEVSIKCIEAGMSKNPIFRI